MRIKFTVIGIVTGVLLTTVAVVLAGNPGGPDTPPAATFSYTLEDIYDRLKDGTDGSPTTWSEPVVAPGVGTGHTLSETMALAPRTDDTNGAMASDVLLGKAFWGLTSGEWGLHTGTATCPTYDAGVPKTGQNKCYDGTGTEICCVDTGQDGDLQKGVAWPIPRFITGTTGVVTDTLTGLIWLETANCAGGPVTWTLAISYSNALYDGCTNCFGTLGDCGLSDGSSPGDWRLPNRSELNSLVDMSQSDPALPDGHPFTNVGSYHFWSSTSVADFPPNSWYIELHGGAWNGASKGAVKHLWPVRGGQ